jgi:hypothetical protein
LDFSISSFVWPIAEGVTDRAVRNNNSVNAVFIMWDGIWMERIAI